MYGPADSLERLAKRFPYVFDQNMLPLPGTSKPEGRAIPLFDGQVEHIAGVDVLPIALPHGPVTVFGYRIGTLAYVTDAKTISDDVITLLKGSRVLVLNALFRRSHPTHLSIPDAIEVARAVGAERTFLTHLTHENFHADLEAELPPGICPRLRRSLNTNLKPMTIRIDYSNMIGESVGGIPETEWSAAATRFEAAHAGFSRLRENGTVGFADAVRDAHLSDQVDELRSSRKRQIQRCHHPWNRRLRSWSHCASHRAPSKRMEHAFRRGSRRLSPAPRSRQRRSGNYRRSSRSAQSPALSVHRYVQVGRHRRDDVSVPRRARFARQTIARPCGAFRIRDRSCSGRIAASGKAARHRCSRYSAECWRPVQRPDSGRYAGCSPDRYRR